MLFKQFELNIDNYIIARKIKNCICLIYYSYKEKIEDDHFSLYKKSFSFSNEDELFNKLYNFFNFSNYIFQEKEKYLEGI